jgi:3-dehydroquinate dehydratase
VFSLSSFADENEVLFPPFTYLKPTGKVAHFSVDVKDGQAPVVISVVEIHCCWIHFFSSFAKAR